MNDTPANPIFVALFFILRCFVPVAVLFGISYLLRKMGLVATDDPEPPDERDENGETTSAGGNENPQSEIAETNSIGNETVAKSKEASQ